MQKKNLRFLSKGILGEKKIKVAEFWIKTQKVRTFFYLIMLTCGTKNVDFRKRCKPLSNGKKKSQPKIK